MSSAIDLKKRTEFFIKDLHAREYMRLGWYRQFGLNQEQIRNLRERKAHHTAFLRDLLRKRGISPAWYARFFYLLGHLFGFISALFPEKFMEKIEATLEWWILMRYQKYFEEMTLDAALRSMIESLQLKKLSHNEPAPDVINLLDHFIQEQKQLSVRTQ
ncbi:demethoxyubiquinone hydroxylase family protein [Pontibacter sp. G13]|uniref:demethoxyubiquinone hydroxylase family protein n=1 Tax=Pontibacter sp. G13 TaxID=3074898 RepID=UPI00288B4044|nr:demethoxyubiquinone hydroxylase family protein [Pontibacter sp. G13]WNJ21472.1 demethoxyubiquinone hydroxylase family protein [Pontibacter sp. G13]